MAKRMAYDLTDAESALLMAVTKDTRAAAGALGAALNGEVGSTFVARAGAAGGRFGARLTRPRTAASLVEVQHEAEMVRARARAEIAGTGGVIDDPSAAGDGSIWGVVGSGALDMAPALVRVHVEPMAAGRSRVQVRATGREGLIKQRIAAKAVDRICGALAGGAP